MTAAATGPGVAVDVAAEGSAVAAGTGVGAGVAVGTGVGLAAGVAAAAFTGTGWIDTYRPSQTIGIGS